MDKTLPLLRFPTLLIVVDDNNNFLTNFKLGIKPYFKCKIFTAGSQALKFIEKQNNLLRDLSKKYLTICIGDVQIDKPVVNFDIAKLHHLIYDATRFDLSALMVTDYAMAGMDGLTLSTMLKDNFLRIIMLTGEAGYDIAVEGFNFRSIDQFILKSEPDYLEKIIESAKNLENDLFIEISQPLIPHSANNF